MEKVTEQFDYSDVPKASSYNGKLSIPVKLGYGSTSIADATAYNFVAVFFLFFLTNIAGISPGISGIIVLIAVVWDSITDPIIGYLSDKTNSRFGRRRPYLIISVIPLIVALGLMFTNFDLSSTAKVIYYILITICFWTAYTLFTIPYFALGAEMTSNYDERTSLRTFAFVGNMAGNFIGMVSPLFIVQFFQGMGQTEENSWSFTAVLLGILSGLTIVVTWISTKGKELNITKVDIVVKDNIFKSLKEILKLKAYRHIIFAAACYLFGYALFQGNLMYFMTYYLGIGEAAMSSVLLTIVISGILFSPIVLKFSKVYEKKTVYVFCLLTTGILMILFQFIGMQSFRMLIVYAVIFTIGSAAYWQLIFSLVYDVSEVDEYHHGRRREGMLTSFVGFSAKLASAFSAIVLGGILQFTGFQPNLAEQSAPVLSGIKFAFTLLPGLFMVLSAVIIIFYPITRERFGLLTQVLENKRQGKPYTTEGIEKLLK